MNYIQQLNTFESLCTGTLSAKSQLIYYKLFKWANRFGLDNTFQLSNLQLMAEACISNEKTFIANRDALKDKGFIDIKPGKKGQPTKYRLIDLTVKYTGKLQGNITVHSTVNPTVNTTGNITVNPTVNTTAIYKEREREKEKHKKAQPEPSGDVHLIIDRLNDVAGTNYKARTPKTRTLIQARLKEGFSLEDFNRVIDKKCREWSNTEMAKYLRPETLFGTKFESYLNQPDAIAVQQDDYFSHGRLV